MNNLNLSTKIQKIEKDGIAVGNKVLWTALIKFDKID